MTSNLPLCKICNGQTFEVFSLPSTKLTGHPIPQQPDNCPYYQCRSCFFCFTTFLDEAQHVDIYDETYWTEQDPDWFERVSETLRLVLLANSLVKRAPDAIDILDFGCGMGGFVETARNSLQLNVWGTDIIVPKAGREYFLPAINRKFDIIVSCEVIEHLPDPHLSFQQLRSWLKPGGALAFQTAQYDPQGERRDWWYVGPGNGHISLYSREAFDFLYQDLGGKERSMWKNYPGVQAWRFEN